MYLTAAEYAQITGRNQAEATEALLERASRLLDARIGYYPRRYEGWKLDLDQLPEYASDAVKEWVTHMLVSLVDNDGAPPTKEQSVSLGRFSVDYGDSSSNSSKLPDEMTYYDARLIDAGLIHRSVPTT